VLEKTENILLTNLKIEKPVNIVRMTNFKICFETTDVKPNVNDVNLKFIDLKEGKEEDRIIKNAEKLHEISFDEGKRLFACAT
jgi:hypothetical protein